MNLAAQHPIQTYQYLVNTDGNKLYDGSGTQLTFLELTASYALYQVSWEESSSFASSSATSSVSRTLLNPMVSIGTDGNITASGTISASTIISHELDFVHVSTTHLSASIISSSQYNGNQFGSIYTDNNTLSVTIPATNTYYKIDGNLTSSYLRGFIFNNQQLTASIPGYYSFNWSVAVECGTDTQELEGTIFINSTSSYYSGSTMHAETNNANRPLCLASNGIVYLNANDSVGLCIQNKTATNPLKVSHAGLTIVRVGE